MRSSRGLERHLTGSSGKPRHHRELFVVSGQEGLQVGPLVVAEKTHVFLPLLWVGVAPQQPDHRQQCGRGVIGCSRTGTREGITTPNSAGSER